MIASQLEASHEGHTLVLGRNSKKKRHIIRMVEKNASMVLVFTDSTKCIPVVLKLDEEIEVEA